MNATTHASGLPITQLGSTIKSHLGIAEKYEGKADEHYKSAGIHLLEAKARIAAGEYEGKFGMFLMRECNDLSDSRAYELISIANGTNTVESIRAKTNARKKAHRARAAFRSGTEKEKATQASTPDKAPTQQPAADTPEQAIIKQIARACQGQPLEKLQALLEWAKASPPPKLTPAQQETAAGLTRHLLEISRRYTAAGIRDELKQAFYDAAVEVCPN